MNFKFLFVVLFVISILSAYFHFRNLCKPEQFVKRSFPVMNTSASITVYDLDAQSAEKALNAAQNKVYEIEKICNIFKQDSELSKLNSTAFKKEVVCSPLLWELMTESDRFYKVSGGSFDVTIRPLMTLWGFHRKRSTLPPEAEIQAVQPRIGWNKVKLDPAKKSVRFTVDGMSIDLGGIAKGFALDKAAAELMAAGVKRAVLDFGGNIRCIAPQEARAFRIGVKDPLHPAQTLTTLELHQLSVATSGSYERFVTIDGKRYSHIMDPRTGKPVANGLVAATVITFRGVDSDALSTILFIDGESAASEICERFPGTGILLMYPRMNHLQIKRFGIIR